MPPAAPSKAGASKVGAGVLITMRATAFAKEQRESLLNSRNQELQARLLEAERNTEDGDFSGGFGALELPKIRTAICLEIQQIVSLLLFL